MRRLSRRFGLPEARVGLLASLFSSLSSVLDITIVGGMERAGVSTSGEMTARERVGED